MRQRMCCVIAASGAHHIGDLLTPFHPSVEILPGQREAGAVYRLLEVNGGRTMNADESFQRFFRDLLAMRNHIAATLEINASAYALAKLGAPPPPFIRSQRVVI